MTFLSDIPSEKLINDLDDIIDKDVANKSDKYNIIDKEIYLFLPNGYGKTRLNNNFFERKLEISVTTRNWRTVNRIVEITSKQNRN